MKTSNLTPTKPSGSGKRKASNLTPSQSGTNSDGEAMDNAIAKFNKCMERSAEILQAGLELISKEFGYGEKVLKEKDLMLELVGKCETQNSPEALEDVVQYVIAKFGSLMSALRILMEGSMDWNKCRRLQGGSTDWNRKVAKCVYNATQKFKGDFFAQVEGVEKLNAVADCLIKLSDDDNDWLVVAGCTHLRIVVRKWLKKKTSTILRQCLVNYPTLKKATLKELKKEVV